MTKTIAFPYYLMAMLGLPITEYIWVPKIAPGIDDGGELFRIQRYERERE